MLELMDKNSDLVTNKQTLTGILQVNVDSVTVCLFNRHTFFFLHDSTYLSRYLGLIICQMSFKMMFRRTSWGGCVEMQLCRHLWCSLFVRTTSGFWVWRTEKSEGVNGYEAKVKPVLKISW